MAIMDVFFSHPNDEESDENHQYNTTSDRETLLNGGGRLRPCFP